MTTAIVPLKGLAAAKSRLDRRLSAPARRELVAWMLERVLQACAGATCVEDVVVMAGDDQAAALAARNGVRVRRQSGPGLQAALREADVLLGAHRPTLVVPADLPLCSPADLEAVGAAGAGGPCVVVAPTHDGGTGALLRHPGGVIPPAFGVGSAAAHAALAARAEVPFRFCHRAGLCADVDTPAQLRAVCIAFPELTALLGPPQPRRGF